MVGISTTLLHVSCFLFVSLIILNRRRLAPSVPLRPDMDYPRASARSSFIFHSLIAPARSYYLSAGLFSPLCYMCLSSRLGFIVSFPVLELSHFPIDISILSSRDCQTSSTTYSAIAISPSHRIYSRLAFDESIMGDCKPASRFTYEPHDTRDAPDGTVASHWSD